MTPKEVFVSMLPFVKLKLALNMIPVAIKVVAFTLAIWGFMYHGAWAVVDGGELFVFENLNFLVLPAILLFAVLPFASLLLRNYARFMVHMGHIAVVVRTIMTNEVPKNQVAVGLDAVNKKFQRASVFFSLDRIVHEAVVELRGAMSGVLLGLGFLTIPAAIFKGNLTKHIAECCHAYTFMQEDAGVYKGAVLGVITYVQGWRQMAKQAVTTTLNATGITLLLYMIGGGLLWLAIGSQSVITIVLSLLFIFITDAIKSCVLDGYLMAVMLAAFLREVRKQGEAEDSVAMIEKVAAMSGSFSILVFQANQSEPLLSQADANEVETSNKI